MQNDDKSTTRDWEILSARGILQLMLSEYGAVHIETLGQLLRLTRSVEQKYTRLRIQRLCS